MFENPGEKLKMLACIELILIIILSVILAIGYSSDRYGDFNILSFLLILAAGSVTAYISSLILYAFGELIDSAERTAGNSSELLHVLNKLRNNTPSHIDYRMSNLPNKAPKKKPESNQIFMDSPML